MIANDNLIIDIHGNLMRLNWDWENPKIQNYLHKCKLRYAAQCPHIKFDVRSMETVPIAVLAKLAKLLDIYQQCNQCLSLLRSNWNDADVRATYAKYGHSAQMPLQGWEELLASLDERWIVDGGAF